MDLPSVVFSTPANPHYARLGGASAVTALVEAFYEHMGREPRARGILALHPADLGPVKQVLVAYLSEWLGGPRHYTALRGAPRLGRVHRPFAIGPAERDAWMHCMDLALAQSPADDTLRAELHAAFAKVAAHLTTPAGTVHPSAPAPLSVPSVPSPTEESFE